MCVWVYWNENTLAKCARPKLQTFAYHFLWSLSHWLVTRVFFRVTLGACFI